MNKHEITKAFKRGLIGMGTATYLMGAPSPAAQKAFIDMLREEGR
ncbi:hypothetical protein [Bifidobacterium pongonis]|nr:hypothetical protein [Bifidobacterium pongonis]